MAEVALGDLSWWQSQLDVTIAWLETRVFIPESIAQAALAVAIVALSFLFSRKSAAWFTERVGQRARKPYIRVHAQPQELFFLAYAIFLLWASILVARTLDFPAAILKTTAILLAVWFFARLASGIVSSHFWAKMVAILIGGIIVLNLLGWFEPTVMILDRAAVNLGTIHLSLLSIVKGLIAFGVLLWLVSLLSEWIHRAFDRSLVFTPSQKVLFDKLAKIFLYTVSILIGLNIVGVDLTALTVFSGALGLGIGFGLQKVFSNLISGIILLIDKTVKPGDVIAIGNTYGWVNFLGARCISVITRDGKEHLIPNENLITEQVENWSYTDTKVRIHIIVNVSYTCDQHRARDLMLQAVAGSPRILKTPKPVCFIMEFGDSAVVHEIRAWIDDPANGIANVKSDIYYRIWDLFKEHGIIIPYNQHNIHLDTEVVDLLRQVAKPAKGE